MFNLFTIHIGLRKPKYYGFEIGSFVNDNDGYGLLVFIYDVDKKMGIGDILFLSFIVDKVNQFFRWL